MESVQPTADHSGSLFDAVTITLIIISSLSLILFLIIVFGVSLCVWKKCCVSDSVTSRQSGYIATDHERSKIVSKTLNPQRVSIHDIDSDIGKNPNNYGTEEYYDNYHRFSPRAPLIGFRN